MYNIGTIWVVVNASEAQLRLVNFIDSGYLVEAVSYSQALEGLIAKMKSFVQQYGGSIPIYLYERLVFQIPSSVAEQIPAIIKGYSEAVNGKVACGMGLTMEEAANACKKSLHTGNIELYDPEKKYDDQANIEKSSRRFSVILPPNIFDPTTPDGKAYQKEADIKEASLPSLQEAMESENQLIQGIAAQMGMQQQPQQPAPGQDPSQPPPRDLLETLHGGQVPGHNPEEEEAQGEEEQPAEGGEEVQELQGEIEEAESITADDKIAAQLDNIKTQIPQIMGLAQKDPQSFKQTMNVINKLIQLAHQRSKSTKKSETREKIDELIKDINNRASGRLSTHGNRFPVGTRLGRYKKVLVEGREKWRQMSSGILQDQEGNQISVKEHNKQSNQNQREENIE